MSFACSPQDQGGTMAYFRQVFTATPHDGPEPTLVLKRTDPDGFMGFPGTVQVTVTYTLTKDNALRIDYTQHAVSALVQYLKYLGE